MTEKKRPDDPATTTLHERLSLLMDGQASGDVEKAIQQEMRQNPAAADLLAGMRQRRESLRRLASATTPTLGDDFADRVIDAAIDRARDEGLDDSHPVMLAGQYPSAPAESQTSLRRRSWYRQKNWRRALSATALAASFAGLILWRGGTAVLPSVDGDGNAQLADRSNPSSIQQDEFVSDFALADAGPATAPTLEGSASPEVDGFSQQDSTDAGLAMGGVDASVAAAAESAATSGNEVDAERNSGTSDGLRIAEQASREMGPDQSVDDGLSTAAFAGAVMVFEVVCEDPSSRDAVFAGAMQAAGLKLESQRPMADGLVSAATDSSGVDADSNFQIIYLSASAKRIDRLYLELLNDSMNVRGVGLSLALSAPILDAAKSLSRESVDPTSVRQDAVAFPVSMDQDGRALANDLDGLDFMPMSRGEGLVGGSVGGDETAQVIFILR